MKKDKYIIESLDMLGDFIKKNQDGINEIIEARNYLRIANSYLEVVIIKIKQEEMKGE